MMRLLSIYVNSKNRKRWIDEDVFMPSRRKKQVVRQSQEQMSRTMLAYYNSRKG